MRLPKIPNQVRHYKRDVLKFGGLNLTSDIHDGEFTRTFGITTSDYPYITQAPDLREHIYGYDDNTPLTWDDPINMYEWDDTLFVITANGNVYREGAYLGNIEHASAMSMAVINTKLVIFPDKYYIDLTDFTLHSMITKSWSGSVTFTEGTDDVTITATGIGTDFVVGDVVDVEEDPQKARALTVLEVSSDSIKITKNDDLSDLIIIHGSAMTSGITSVMSSIPDMSLVCSSNNRIWGCSDVDNTIYASALGDPLDFFTYGSDSGAYAVAVGSDGDFTGICEYSGAVHVWKNDILHKILGQFPSEYYMTTSNIPGVGPGSHNSLVQYNGILYYVGEKGIYAFGGNRPQPISDKLFVGNFIMRDKINGFMDAAAGVIGGCLYVSCVLSSYGVDVPGEEYWPSTFQLFVYDLRRGLWVSERDDVWITKFVGRYMLDWRDARADAGTNRIVEHKHAITDDQTWLVELAEAVEDTFSRKGYTRLNVRLDMSPGSNVTIYAKEDRRKYRSLWSKTRPAKMYYLGPMHVDFSDVGTPTCRPYTLPLPNEKVYATIDAESVECSLVMEGTEYYFEADFPSIDRQLTFSMDTDADPMFKYLRLYELSTETLIANEEHYIAFWKRAEDFNPSTMLVPIRLGRCDRYQLKFEGTGQVTIRGIEREYVVGSER